MAEEAKKRLRLEDGNARSELEEDSSDSSSSSDSDSADEGSEEGVTDSDDNAAADVDNNSSLIPQSGITLRWNDEAGKNIKGMLGTGSKSTEKRVRRRQLELEKAASQSYSIVGLFERQRSLRLSIEAEGRTPAVPLKDVEHGKPMITHKTKEDVCHEALQDLKRFLGLKGEQKRQYRKFLKPGSDFHRHHLLVSSFLMLQQQKHEFPNCNRRGLAAIVAKSYGKGIHIGLNIVRWERS
jgi:hypothetical protein